MAHCVFRAVGHLAYVELSCSLLVSVLTLDPFAVFAFGPLVRHVMNQL
jgi:hypothetical protein